MGEDELLYHVEDKVAYFTINREKQRNALNQQVGELFMKYLDKADKDENVRAICLTGKGEKSFCAGADLKVAFGDEEDSSSSVPRAYAELFKKMTAYGKPLVARVNGPCLAGGIGIMLSCDIVIARNDTFFCTPEVNVGIFPMMIAAMMYRDLGWKKATEMALTGRKISAFEAEKIGLITKAVKPSILDKEVKEVLSTLTLKSPIGIRIGKNAVMAIKDMSFNDQIDYLCDNLFKLTSTADAREGISAFNEKRKPEFKGI